MYIWVVIGYADDMAGIDDDCIFGNKDAADEKWHELCREYPDQNFTVDRLTIPKAVEIEIQDSRLPDAVQAHADSLWEVGKAIGEIADVMREFVTCTCSADSMGETPCVPQIDIKVKKGEKE